MHSPQSAPARLPWRTLREAGLDGEVTTLFKSDHRSRVWAVDGDGRAMVVKRFDYSPARQRLAWLLGCHPAQRELDRQRCLAAAGVAVAAIVEAGVEPVDGFGCRAWLATEHAGVSLQAAMRDAPPDRIAEWLDEAAALTHRLLDAGWTFKDLKPSNILVTPRGELMLIDVGSACRSTSSRRVRRMLAVMARVLARDGVPAELRERYQRKVRQGRAR